VRSTIQKLTPGGGFGKKMSPEGISGKTHEDKRGPNPKKKKTPPRQSFWKMVASTRTPSQNTAGDKSLQTESSAGGKGGVALIE